MNADVGEQLFLVAQLFRMDMCGAGIGHAIEGVVEKPDASNPQNDRKDRSHRPGQLNGFRDEFKKDYTEHHAACEGEQKADSGLAFASKDEPDNAAEARPNDSGNGGKEDDF